MNFLSKKWLNKFLCLSLIVLPVSSFSYDRELAEINLSDELIECAAYSLITARQFTNDPKEEKDWKDISINFFIMAKKYSRTTKDEAMLATLKLSINNQLKEIDYNYFNEAILTEKHGDLCKEAYEHPEKRLDYWLNKKRDSVK